MKTLISKQLDHDRSLPVIQMCTDNVRASLPVLLVLPIYEVQEDLDSACDPVGIVKGNVIIH